MVTKLNQGFESLAHGSGVSSPLVARLPFPVGVLSSGLKSTRVLVRLALKATPSCFLPAPMWWQVVMVGPRGLEWLGEGGYLCPSLSGVPVPNCGAHPIPSYSSQAPSPWPGAHQHHSRKAVGRRAASGSPRCYLPCWPAPAVGTAWAFLCRPSAPRALLGLHLLLM